MFEKKEWFAFIIAVFVIGLAFGFNDGSGEFIFNFWIINLFWMFVMVAVSLLFYQWVQKKVAKMHGFKTEFKLWSIDTFNWGWWRGFMVKKQKDLPHTFNVFGREITIKSFPMGIIISLIVTIVTNGNLFFLGITHYDLMIKRAKRMGRKFVNVTGYDEAKIAISGPLAATALVIVFGLLNTRGMFDKMIVINSWIALFNMIPFFQFDGGKIWNGSRVVYIFGVVFIAAIAVLVHFLDFMPLLIVSGVLAIAAAIIFFIKRQM
ncbi:hypothetical protein CL616_05010 [archaeon]|nr:hypothetical protein [archaeon]